MSDGTRAADPLPGSLDALEEAIYHYDRHVEAKTPMEAADRLVALNNAMSDLRTFHPEYEYNSGRMPWDRKNDE